MSNPERAEQIRAELYTLAILTDVIEEGDKDEVLDFIAARQLDLTIELDYEENGDKY